MRGRREELGVRAPNNCLGFISVPESRLLLIGPPLCALKPAKDNNSVLRRYRPTRMIICGPVSHIMTRDMIRSESSRGLARAQARPDRLAGPACRRRVADRAGTGPRPQSPLSGPDAARGSRGQFASRLVQAWPGRIRVQVVVQVTSRAGLPQRRPAGG